MKKINNMLCRLKPWWFYDKEDLSPKRCPDCLSKKFYVEVIAASDYTVLEEEHRCRKCESTVQYWAYGNFDPSFLPRKAMMEHINRQDNETNFGV